MSEKNLKIKNKRKLICLRVDPELYLNVKELSKITGESITSIFEKSVKEKINLLSDQIEESKKRTELAKKKLKL